MLDFRTIFTDVALLERNLYFRTESFRLPKCRTRTRQIFLSKKEM